MKIIADENVFEPIIDFLKSEGYEVVSDCVCGLSGISDDRIYKIVVEQQMVIVTMDKDFCRKIRMRTFFKLMKFLVGKYNCN